MIHADAIEQVFKEKIAEISPTVTSVDKITSGTSLSVDYGMDSINSITLIIEIEEAFDICFEDNDFEDIDFFSYDDVLRRIVEKVNANNE